ncbi:hypothetical protein LINPERPRIM_LOCUS29205, partial [Linum perenne]
QSTIRCPNFIFSNPQRPEKRRCDIPHEVWSSIILRMKRRAKKRV